MSKLSIIIPSLNEADNIKQTLALLQCYRLNGHEVILADGGSTDQTVNISKPLIDKFIQSEPGRAQQMNSGAKLASGDILLFLHADTQLPDKADELILKHAHIEHLWGRFDLCFSRRKPLLNLISACMNIRTTLSGIITGDHALFIDKTLFEQIKGFPNILLMEDIAISRRLLRHRRPIRIQTPLTTSSRRWEKQGIIKTVCLMWCLRLLFFFGVNANTLAQYYYPHIFHRKNNNNKAES